MPLPRHLVWIALLAAPACLWAEPAPRSLAEQLSRARSDNDQAAVVELCRRELERSPKDAAILADMFRAQIELGDLDRAAATLGALEKSSTSPAALAEFRGDLAHASDKPADNAISAWKAALAGKPAEPSTLLGKIADAQDTEAHWSEAADALRAFLKAKPNHAARTAQLAICLLNAGHPEDADKQALSAAQLDASDETVKTTAPLFDRLRPQLAALRKLSAPDRLLDRALIYYRAGAYAAALEDARHAAGAAESVAARLLQGQCLWQLGRSQEAATLQMARIADKAWFNDARRWARLRAPDALTASADAAAFVRAHAARAMALLDVDQPVLALNDAQLADATEQKANRPTADTQVVLAAVLLRNDRSADALAAARRATGTDPRNPDGWALYGRLEQEAADFPSAVEHLSRALALREDAGWLHRRETCLRSLGRNAEADRDAQRAAQLSLSRPSPTA